MDDASQTAGIGHNAPAPHVPFIERANDLKDEAKIWLDGSEISTEAEAEKVGLLVDMASKLEKEAEAERKAITKPIDEAKAAVMADFKPVETTTTLIKAAAKKALTVWLNKQAAIKAEAERVERERLEAERARIQAEAQKAVSLEDIEAKQAEITEHLKAEKALERAANATAKVTGAGRTIGMRTVYDIEITDPKALAAWFWTHQKAMLLAWMTDEARAMVRASSGNATIDGVKVTSQKVAV